MNAFIHDNTDRDRVRHASDIVRIVGEAVRLKPRGREFVGLCPFHDDHNPSMSVIPAKGIFHCFVCGTGGDVFTFVQKMHGMEFREALEYLAERAGIVLTPRKAPAQGAEPAISRRDLVQVNAFAAEFYRSVLRHGEHGAAGRQVIDQRGISAEMVQAFGLGVAPNRWDGLILKARASGVSEDQLLAAGLIKRREGAPGCYDLLRHRLIFPIQDQVGRVIAFGGRKINPEDEPKYLNSPETAVFEKSGTLYGLHQASRSIQQERAAIVTEGYTDVIACHQAGFTTAVAALGTALTARHASMLRRLCETIILLFDSDDAGQRAADRATEVFFAEPVDVRVCTLGAFSDAKDPDELLKRPGGAEAFRAALSASTDLLEFRYRRLGAQAHGKGPAAMQRLLEDELARLVELGLSSVDPLRRALIMRRLSEISGLSQDVIAKATPVGRRPRAFTAPEAAVRAVPARLLPADWLLGAALIEPQLRTNLAPAERSMLAAAAYSSPVLASAVRHIEDMESDGRPCALADLLARIDDPGEASTLVDLTRRVERETEADPERLGRLWSDCLAQVKRARGDEADDASALTRLAAARSRHATLGGDPRAMPRPRRAEP